ncbi:GNAT family N-acetyltransferase [Streptomyces sp. NPDC057654]|uniref:GNAT family N-acetyltransferase n=1 Tax=Streptomyces sp. NPDC057654 TaxID=3346196 RepID=UPI0036A784FA
MRKPWGYYIEVAGNPLEVGRHVLPVADESLVRSATAAVSTPWTWMKMPAEPEDIEPWLPPGWVLVQDESTHVMATDFAATNPVVPEGYTAVAESRESVVHVRVLDGAGELAAKGQVAVVGEAAVVDQVMTEEAHQRRGLGQFVMRTLADRAVGEGAGFGVLAATDAGRALYETLGWKKASTLTECIYRP